MWEDGWSYGSWLRLFAETDWMPSSWIHACTGTYQSLCLSLWISDGTWKAEREKKVKYNSESPRWTKDHRRTSTEKEWASSLVRWAHLPQSIKQKRSQKKNDKRIHIHKEKKKTEKLQMTKERLIKGFRFLARFVHVCGCILGMRDWNLSCSCHFNTPNPSLSLERERFISQEWSNGKVVGARSRCLRP